ncbi:sensor histidine kinase [Altererythrobacter endophyticus]|uniref:histidine kinase n=1 Tax=Altericroceibacterium endophyticum TaxID=1808508 RepID=A0A6I4T599_9SPHN|nr:sensor histidine kinase [Altericroceibacterium endophyticum]
MITSAAKPESDAGWRNMQLLIQLRWTAVFGQLVTIGVVIGVLGISLPLWPLLVVPVMLAAINLISSVLLRHFRVVSNFELTVALLVDVVALGWQLHHSGGAANPFASLFLLQVVIGAIILKPKSSWIVVATALVALAAINVNEEPLILPAPHNDAPMRLYLLGSFVSFTLIAILLTVFLTRMSRNLRERDAALAAIRQRAAEEDHIVRMGLLASGAAHELGTPLSLMSVLIGDWKRLPQLAGDREIHEDIEEMDNAVKRCKTIVSNILMSAGEARGEAPRVTTLRNFIEDIVAEWRLIRRADTFEYHDDLGSELTIVADPALRQVIGNIIDNAAEASPGWISISARKDETMLYLTVEDRGPGFSEEILASFGHPYRSTKGKPGGGLGLFLLVNVLRKMGGQAQAENREQGGARVFMELPLKALAYERRKTE